MISIKTVSAHLLLTVGTLYMVQFSAPLHARMQPESFAPVVDFSRLGSQGTELLANVQRTTNTPGRNLRVGASASQAQGSSPEVEANSKTGFGILASGLLGLACLLAVLNCQRGREKPDYPVGAS